MDDPQARLSTTEVMTVPLVAATFFGDNLDKTRLFIQEYGYMPNMINMISKGHLNRRIHAIEPGLWRGLLSSGSSAGLLHSVPLGGNLGYLSFSCASLDKVSPDRKPPAGVDFRGGWRPRR